MSDSNAPSPEPSPSPPSFPGVNAPDTGRHGSYSERVRNWGESSARNRGSISVGATQSLATPARRVSLFESRVQEPLVAIGEDEDVEENGGAGSADGANAPQPDGASAPAISTITTSTPPVTNRPTPTKSILRGGRTASTIQGKKTVRLSVLPVSGPSGSTIRHHATTTGFIPGHEAAAGRTLSFAPKRLLDIENGKSILVSTQNFLDKTRFQEIGSDGALVVTAKATVPIAREDVIFFNERGSSLQDKIKSGDVRNIEPNSEVDFIGALWRGALRRLLVATFDSFNGLRITRQLQLFLPFLTAYESYIIDQVIEAINTGRKSEFNFVLKIAFKNRNVTRVIVQLLSPRWDFFWHTHSQVTSNRVYDLLGQVPFIGITRFPSSENFLTTRNHALGSIFRVLLGQGGWITRTLTGGRQGLNTDNSKNLSQNLAAESNGFEAANRNQYGTFFGREKTNAFRLAHRLPTDESIVRTFVTQPMPTMVNNGVVHTLRQLAKHWHNMLTQPAGNFAHQRQEQLGPFEAMRFHMPTVCVVLSTLRGRNKWDSEVLGPFIRKCQELKASTTADACKYLVREMQENIVTNLCAGVASVIDPLRSWLDAIDMACDGIQAEAQEVYKIVTSVEIGIRLGHDLMTQVNWKIPSDKELKKAILAHIRGENPGPLVSERRIRSALLLTTPRDKRTLIELVRNGHLRSKPAQLLLGRVKTLLQRDLRREHMNAAIRELSMGEHVSEVVHDEWYWLEEGDRKGVYIYDAKVTGQNLHRFVHVDSGIERFVTLTDSSMQVRAYVPVAEAITRAQRAFMVIELDLGKKYTYGALMEFTFIRNALRRLIVISQMACEELDNARLNVLREVQRSNQIQLSVHDLEVGKTYYTYDSVRKEYEKFVYEKMLSPGDGKWNELARKRIVLVPPQSIIVVGGGPTGLVTTIHCAEAVLTSGGVVRLYEARDAFAQGGSSFERAQIVRLDARWIAMLRYHLGTGFEDVYIPASGETDSQLGNVLPTQGFVEITIKDLENMLHVEVSKLWSKGVIQVYTDSKAQYDYVSNSLTKVGSALKLEDKILRRVDADGNPCKDYVSWKVADLVYQEALSVKDLQVGQDYGVYVRLQNSVMQFRLTGVDLDTRTYTFKSLQAGVDDVKATVDNLPSVYPPGTTRHADVSTVIVECVQKGKAGGYVRDELPMKVIRKEKFTLDIGHTHVIECVGKPHGSKVHFCATTYEPYGVCCIQGLKISMGMHNFGEKRWGQGVIDDIRSVGDRNTRIIGDFTKMVRQPPIAALMHDLMKTKNWQAHFEGICRNSKYPNLDQECGGIAKKLLEATEWHAHHAPSFKRQTLQTRFFETGDNYYLGMEFTREYDRWKNMTCDEIVKPLQMRGESPPDVGRMKGTISHHVDRLWYEATLEIIRKGDVYNPGARHRVPHLYMINSYFDEKLGSFPVGESFRLKDRPEEKYEIVIKGREIVVRNVEGFISKMAKNTPVLREGNLTRSPDGNSESRVSLATFPVAHYVNYRTARLNDENKGYLFAFIGDEQSTPHFMRYSGLTGACINSMLFNNFIKQAVDGHSFEDRFREYSRDTNWSNSEVVTRGTGANYGQDGFLRPGFAYDHGIDYLHSKVIEFMETKQDLNAILSRDWFIKFAAALIPRGLELSEDFLRTFYNLTQKHIFNKFVKEAVSDKSIELNGLEDTLKARYTAMEAKRIELSYDTYWEEYYTGLEILGSLSDEERTRLKDYHVEIAKRLEQLMGQIVEFAATAYLRNERVSSEMFNQPKPVDSIVDDFAAEAQSFALSLVLSAAFSSGALAFALFGEQTGQVFATLIAIANIFIAFATMTNVSRYKIRNEEARVRFFETKFNDVKKAVFSILDDKIQDSTPAELNPFAVELDQRVGTFLDRAMYYDIEEPKEFKEEYDQLKSNINDPERIRVFQQRLTSYYIADKYHVNSYIQEFLVNIVKTLDEMHFLLTQRVDKASGSQDTKALFDRLNNFTPMLDASLQRGPILWGFIKQRAFKHWDCLIVFRYFYSQLCCARSSGKTAFAPIQTETLGIVRHAKKVSAFHQNLVLRREVLDLEYLYWATRESDIASLIIVAVFMVFLASIIFTISRIVTEAGGGRALTDVAYWALLFSALSAILAVFHFIRKIGILIGLWFTLSRKIREAKTTESAESIRLIRGVTFTQILLTLARLIASLAAAIALPWTVAVNGYEDQISLPREIPFWIAFGAVVTAIGTVIFFFFVEYVVRYHLPPRLGELVCEAFREEIENMYTVIELPLNDIETKQVQERTTWEYVAREFLHQYRFDSVFAADRFGAILQYVQAGMDPRV